jgi:hypothetical protein
MNITEATVSFTLTLRETQSLLLYLRCHDSASGGTVSVFNLPRGVRDDLRQLRRECEQALLMRGEPHERNG